MDNMEDKKMYYYRIDTRILKPKPDSNISILTCETAIVPFAVPFDTYAKECNMDRAGKKHLSRA